ncbi:hypothetical protein RB195_008125 [Necator americanus]|uniref:PPM-type phosphatase domain-containing protein n=1 Tax=Necator americanus TaxID=51031 RepID=A0ABR1CM48_NECAM
MAMVRHLTDLKDNSENLVPLRLTVDHKPESEVEQARIRKAGGSVALKRVVWTRPLKHYLNAVTRGTPTESIPVLAVSRSLGDIWSFCEDTKEFTVSPEPDLAVREITPEDVCLVLASDGLTNVLGPNETAAIIDEEECITQLGVNRCEDLVYRDKHTNLARVLVATAIRKWKNHIADNVTAITVTFDAPYIDLPPDHPCVEKYIENNVSIDKVFVDDPQTVIRISPSASLKLRTYRTPIVYKGARDPHFSVVEYSGPGFLTHTEERLLEERYRVKKSNGCDDRIKPTRSDTPKLIESDEETVVISAEIKTTPKAVDIEEGRNENEEMQPAPMSQGTNKDCSSPSHTLGVAVRRASTTRTRRGPCRSICVNVEDKVITPSGSVDIKIRSPTPRSVTKKRVIPVPQIRKENDPPLTPTPLTGTRKRSHRVHTLDSESSTPIVLPLNLDRARWNSSDLNDTGSSAVPPKVRSAPSTPSKACSSSFTIGSKWSLSKLDRKTALKEESSGALEVGEPPSKMGRLIRRNDL